MKTAAERLQFLRALAERMSQGECLDAAAATLGVPGPTARRWRNAYASGGIAALEPRKSCGRPALADLMPEEGIAKVKALALKCESVAMAWAVYSMDAECPDEIREAVSAGRVPPSLLALAKPTPEIHALHRGPRTFQLNGQKARRDMTELMPDGSRREIKAGDWFELDDMSLNQPFWFNARAEDCPGDKLVERYGKSLGRQSLWCIDVASGKWLGFELLGRRRDSYRAEDILRFLRRVFEDHGLPRRGLRLEQGIWKSKRIKGVAITGKADVDAALAESSVFQDFDQPAMPKPELDAIVGGLASIGLEVVHARTPGQKGIIETGFRHLQKVINLAGHA
jgi:hypothetical protein